MEDEKIITDIEEEITEIIADIEGKPVKFPFKNGFLHGQVDVNGMTLVFEENVLKYCGTQELEIFLEIDKPPQLKKR